MRGTFIFCMAFFFGIGGALYFSDFFVYFDVSRFIPMALYPMIFFLGIDFARDFKIAYFLKLRNLVFPLITIVGTLMAGMFMGMLWPGISFLEGMMVSAGFGYASLSSLILEAEMGAQMGALALLSNVFRELFTLLFSGQMARYLGGVAPMLSAGSNSMDTCLASILKASGREWLAPSIVHGFILTLLVPILLSVLIFFVE
jgi:uncharacterized membrane protein YbjE (DUF340 family)